MNYETILNKSRDDFSEYFHFCKIYYQNEDTKIKDTIKENLKQKFPFWDNPNPEDNKYKNVSSKDFALNWLKNNQKEKEIDISDVKKISNIENLEVYTKSLIPYSFAIQTPFTLESPYFSRDDDEFYIINNPCLKEKVFKVPMVRGSGWKGALLNGAREIINESDGNPQKIANLKSYFRVFGVGDESFRDIVDKVNDNAFKLFFMLSGMAINVNDDVKNIFQKYKESKAGKGRAIFYPTYFDKYSIELINPHNRQTKAGTNPIHYEVVPKGTKGELQIVYIPFDGVMQSNAIIEQEAKEDLEFLKLCIDKALANGIGAKTKLGWGKGKDVKTNCFWSDR